MVRSGVDHQVLVDDEGMSIAIESENGERQVVTGDGATIAGALRGAGFAPMRADAIALSTVAGRARSSDAERRGHAGVRVSKPTRRTVA